MSLEKFIYSAVVTDVYDGDTISVEIDLGFDMLKRGVRLRLAGINAPEVRGESRSAGIASRDFLRNLVESANNQVVIKTVKDSTEKYGRYLAYLYVDNICVNDLLVVKGFAEYHKY